MKQQNPRRLAQPTENQQDRNLTILAKRKNLISK
jgi:hypothetical protein